MNRKLLSLAVAAICCLSLTSCYTNHFSVGDGAKSGVEVRKKNHYLIWGLATISTADPKTMAGGAKDYDVTIKHSFIDGLIASLTFSLYTPTTTVVTK